MSRTIVVTDGVQGPPGPPGPNVVVRTTAEWEADDLVLNSGYVGYDTDTGTLKVGDGSTAWSELPGISGSGSGDGAQEVFYAGGIVSNDLDASGGNFTTIDIYGTDGTTLLVEDFPRANSVGQRGLIRSGANAGLWTITASGPCTKAEVLGGQIVVVSPYPQDTAVFIGLNVSSVSGGNDPTQPATEFVLLVPPSGAENVVTGITTGTWLTATPQVGGNVHLDLVPGRGIPAVTAGFHNGWELNENALLPHAAGDPEDARIPAVTEIDGIALAAPRVAALGGQPITTNNGFWEVFEVQPNGTNHELYYEVDDFGGSTVQPGDIYFHRVHFLNGYWTDETLQTGMPVHVGSGDKYGNSIILTWGDGLDCDFLVQRYPYQGSKLDALDLSSAIDEIVPRRYVAIISPTTISAFGGSITAGVSLVVGAFNGLFPVGERIVVWDGDHTNAAGYNGNYVSNGSSTFTFDSIAPFNDDELGTVYSSSGLLNPADNGQQIAWMVNSIDADHRGLKLVADDADSSLATELETRLNRYYPSTPVVPHLHVSKYVTYDPDFPLDGSATHVGGQAIEDGQNITLLDNSSGTGGVWTLHLGSAATRATTGFGSMVDGDIGQYDHVSYTGTNWAYFALFRLYGDSQTLGMAPNPPNHDGIFGGVGVSRSYRPDLIATNVTGDNITVLNADGTTTVLSMAAQTGTFCILVLDTLQMLTVDAGTLVQAEAFGSADGTWIASGWNMGTGAATAVVTTGYGNYGILTQPPA